MKQLVILGAGTAGTMVANQLRTGLPAERELTVVDPAGEHPMPPKEEAPEEKPDSPARAGDRASSALPFRSGARGQRQPAPELPSPVENLADALRPQLRRSTSSRTTPTNPSTSCSRVRQLTSAGRRATRPP